jgi:hypothetical protein
MANNFGYSYNVGQVVGGAGVTGDSQIQAMYSDIVGDLAVYFNNMVLLPNASLIALNYPIQGAVGNTVKIPVQSAYDPAEIVPEARDIIPDYANDFATTAVMLEVAKRGAGTFISSEAVEDGGASVVTSSVVNQLAQALAQATDIAGFQTLLTGAEGTLADSDSVNVETVGTGTGTADYCLVMSPQAAAYAAKRAPSVNMDADINADGWVTTGTARNGFAQVRPEFIVGMASTSGTGAGITVDHVAEAVAKLRSANAPTGADGNYVGVLSPWQEYALGKELATAGSNGFIQNPSVIGNQTLATGAIGTLLGVTFYRSNNMPQGVTVA